MEINNNTSFDLKGKWRVFGRIADSADNHKEFPGTLTYGADKKDLIIDITAYDEHLGPLGKYFPDFEIIPIIEGRTNEGYVYLFHCFVTTGNWSNVLEPISIESIQLCANALLIGGKPLASINGKEVSWEDIQLKEARVEYKNLDYWAGGFQLKSCGGIGTDILKMELSKKPVNERIEDTTITYNHGVNYSRVISKMEFLDTKIFQRGHLYILILKER